MNNLKPLNIKKTTYDVGNPGLAWDMHKIVVGLNRLIGSQSPYGCSIYIYPSNCVSPLVVN
jgi:hypothetical protein